MWLLLNLQEGQEVVGLFYFFVIMTRRRDKRRPPCIKTLRIRSAHQKLFYLEPHHQRSGSSMDKVGTSERNQILLNLKETGRFISSHYEVGNTYNQSVQDPSDASKSEPGCISISSSANHANEISLQNFGISLSWGCSLLSERTLTLLRWMQVQTLECWGRENQINNLLIHFDQLLCCKSI